MSRLVRTLARLPLLVAILATVLALGFLVPAQGAAAAVAALPVAEAVERVFDDASLEASGIDGEAERDADPHPLPDAVLAAAAALPAPPAVRPAAVRPDPEFPSLVTSPDRPPSASRLAPRGGHPG